MCYGDVIVKYIRKSKKYIKTLLVYKILISLAFKQENLRFLPNSKKVLYDDVIFDMTMPSPKCFKFENFKVETTI